MTEEVRGALSKGGVVLHDHVIVGGGSYESFKSLGLL
ncbi:MAG TPA: hypothetical protein DCE33_04485, partial [Rhodospirillaceae bacterium]|nr:hypothetical protein [Rhodospirillaceae bacterium]